MVHKVIDLNVQVPTAIPRDERLGLTKESPTKVLILAFPKMGFFGPRRGVACTQIEQFSAQGDEDLTSNSVIKYFSICVCISRVGYRSTLCSMFVWRQ